MSYQGFFSEEKKTNQEEWHDHRLPREYQLERIKAVIERELTEKQREILLLIMSGHSQKEIAEEKGVCCSTICRTFHRAMDKVKRFTRY